MLSCCMEHILTKDALYLLSYISTRFKRATVILYTTRPVLAREKKLFSKLFYQAGKKSGICPELAYFRPFDY